MTRHRDIDEPTVLLDGPPLEPGLLVVRTSDTDHPHCWSGQRQPIDRFRQREENPGGIPWPPCRCRVLGPSTGRRARRPRSPCIVVFHFAEVVCISSGSMTIYDVLRRLRRCGDFWRSG